MKSRRHDFLAGDIGLIVDSRPSSWSANDCVDGVPAAPAVTEPSERLCSVCCQIDLVKELTAWREHDSRFSRAYTRYVWFLDTMRYGSCPMCRFILLALEKDPGLADPPWGPDTTVVAEPQLFGYLRVPYLLWSSGFKNYANAVSRLGVRLAPKTRYAEGSPQPQPRVDGPHNMRGAPIPNLRHGFQLQGDPARRQDVYLLRGRQLPDRFDIGRARGWLYGCSDNHGSSCQPVEAELNTWIMKNRCFRLIDVSRRCVSESCIAPSQWIHNWPQAVPDFAALSYVWGQGRHLKLCRETADALFSDGGLVGNTPQTIVDAMVVCSELRIPYLWLDVLCIRQDDETVEAALIQMMDNIYSSAVLTIVVRNHTVDSHIVFASV